MEAEKPELTRRRDPQARGEAWQIWYDDVRVGSIVQAAGLGASTHWAWSCGFHPGSDLRDHRGGSAATFRAARAAFVAAWAEYLPKCMPEGFDEWRHQAAWTAEKYARWERGERSAPPWPLPGFVFRAAKNAGPRGGA